MAVKKAVLRLDPHAKVEVDRAHDKVDVESTLPRKDLAHVMVEEGYQVT
jgi:copper chaperone CopZ